MSSILFLTGLPPVPPVSGDRIRNLGLMKGLDSLGWSVSLFTLDPEHRVGQAERGEIERLFACSIVNPIHISPARRRVRYLRDVALRRPVHRGFLFDRDVSLRLRNHLETTRYDAILLSQLFMATYVPSGFWGRTIFDSQNAEAQRLIAMEKVHRGTLRGVVSHLQQAPVREYEARVVEESALTLAVSEIDAEYFRALPGSRVSVIQNGVSVESYRPRDRPASTREILLLGSLNYSANIDAATYFLEEILPAVASPDAHVSVVGLDPPSSLRRIVDLVSRASLVGYVTSVTPYLERSRVLVVPLRYGGGTRLKILEALAAGLPVVSTSIGCEGLGLRHNEEILIADEPSEFARQVERVLDDDALSQRLSTSGRRAVVARFDWIEIARELDRDLRHLVAMNARREKDPAQGGPLGQRPPARVAQ